MANRPFMTLGVGVLVAFSNMVAAQSLPPNHVDGFSGKPRVVIISDIGNEPDDQMSFVRFLLYSNEFDVEAMIATTSTWQKTKTHAETMHRVDRGVWAGAGEPAAACEGMAGGERTGCARVYRADWLRDGGGGRGQVVGGVAGDLRRLGARRSATVVDVHLGRSGHAGAGAS